VASISSDSAITPDPAVSGTSVSAALVSGVAAMYLHDHPNGTASLPWVVEQVIKSNANICPYNPQTAPCSTVGLIANRGSSDTRDRLLNMSFLTALAANPIDNQRFFVWQHYSDFLSSDPDEAGLDFWTRNITGNPVLNTGCGLDRTDVNTNNSCTYTWRINTSLAFWVDKYPSMFTGNYGLTSGNNSEFVKDCYSIYLGEPDAEHNAPVGYQFWLDDLTNNYGNPASPAGVTHLIDAFLSSNNPASPGSPAGYRLRFGAS